MARRSWGLWKKKNAEPEGFEVLRPTLDAIESELRESTSQPQELSLCSATDQRVCARSKLGSVSRMSTPMPLLKSTASCPPPMLPRRNLPVPAPCPSLAAAAAIPSITCGQHFALTLRALSQKLTRTTRASASASRSGRSTRSTGSARVTSGTCTSGTK